mmetsp:Transcript_73831/g.146811  ORF Transcript_73831/g.146811 Transcript_73831/m.146811 type:complete len:108 (-) Transcript_73831:117-440(-)
MAAQQLLAPGGQLHITLKRGEPYDSWSAVSIAKMCGLRVLHCSPFLPNTFPGYAHRRTIGDDHAGDAEQHRRNAEIGESSRTFAFAPPEAGSVAQSPPLRKQGRGGK